MEKDYKNDYTHLIIHTIFFVFSCLAEFFILKIYTNNFATNIFNINPIKQQEIYLIISLLFVNLIALLFIIFDKHYIYTIISIFFSFGSFITILIVLSASIREKENIQSANEKFLLVQEATSILENDEEYIYFRDAYIKSFNERENLTEKESEYYKNLLEESLYYYEELIEKQRELAESYNLTPEELNELILSEKEYLSKN